MPPSEAAFAPQVPEKPRQPAIRVEETAYKDFPVLGEEDFKVFGQQAQDIYEAYAEVVKWLKMPYLHDDFTDHLERSAWLKGLSPEERSRMMDNKFRNNPVAIAILNLNNLKSYLAQVKGGSSVTFPDLRPERTLLPTVTDPVGRQEVMSRIEHKMKEGIQGLEKLLTKQEKTTIRKSNRQKRSLAS
jgi:hypothetical protein